jgi:WhiB family redox-sensing transcriptional regulator
MAVDRFDARRTDTASRAQLRGGVRRLDVVACDQVITPGGGRRVNGTLSPCLVDPDRWVEGGDDPALKALCRSCPRRWPCAMESLKTGGIEGMVAGVHVPKAGRGRGFALRQLQSLVAYAGYTSQP